MSRIGRLPVNLPAGVTVTVSPDNVVSVKGPLGTLSQKVDSDIKVEVGTHTDVHTQKEIPAVLVLRPTNQPRHRSLHGLYRALINNMVIGVSKGYEIIVSNFIMLSPSVCAGMASPAASHSVGYTSTNSTTFVSGPFFLFPGMRMISGALFTMLKLECLHH